MKPHLEVVSNTVAGLLRRGMEESHEVKQGRALHAQLQRIAKLVGRDLREPQEGPAVVWAFQCRSMAPTYLRISGAEVVIFDYSVDEVPNVFCVGTEIAAACRPDHRKMKNLLFSFTQLSDQLNSRELYEAPTVVTNDPAPAYDDEEEEQED